jgi:hypothetical protein
MAMTKEEAKAFLRTMHKTPQIEITDLNEIGKLLTFFALTKSIRTSNNQHSWTSTYIMDGIEYDVTDGISDIPIIHKQCTWEEMGL